LITGASSGIGAALARRFAADGAELLLVARRQDRLEALVEDLRAVRPGTIVRIHIADLCDPAACDGVIAAAGAELDVLINNAGIGEYGVFAAQDVTALERMMLLNIHALVRLTRGLLPRMLARQSGWILNIASLAGFQPTPYMAVYGATKSFVLDFSMALWQEVRKRGVCVTCVCPGSVATEFFDHGGYDARREDFLNQAANPTWVAEQAYAALKRRKPVFIPGVPNRLAALLQRFAPLKLVTRVSGKLLGPRK
jgi:short-subunit dehydrogenase